MRLEPGLHGVLAVGAGEFVLLIRGLQRGANFIFALGEQSAVFRAKRRVAVRRAHGHGESLHSGKRQHAGNVARAGGVDRAVGGAALAASPQFPFEYDEHDVSRSAFRHRGFAHGGAPLFALRDKPFEIVPGLIRERQDFSQIRHQGFDSRLIHHAAHWTFARYWCMNCTTTAPSPTPEATRLTEPWRTSPTTKIPGTLVSSKLGSRLSVHEAGFLPS